MEDADERKSQSKKERPPLKAIDRLRFYLAQRDHSERELTRKLSRYHGKPEIDEALETARRHRWLRPPDEIAESMAGSLHRKNRGIHKINRTLMEKGLPSVTRDSEQELEKARSLVFRKFGEGRLDRETAAKAGRFLQSRGFDLDTIRKVVFAGNFTPDDAE